MARQCMLHIGPAKTGTTAIQTSLWKASDSLRKRGVLYPRQERNHLFMVSPFLEEPEAFYYNIAAGRVDADSIAAHHRDAQETFLSDIGQGDCETVIVSSEHFSLLAPEGIAALKAWLAPHFDDFRVLCYARSPVMQLPSRLQQTVKIGRQRLEEAQQSPPVTKYKGLIEDWVAVFGRDAVTVRPYPGDPPERCDVVEDFLRTVGAWSDEDDFTVISSNQSLSGAGMLVADALNSFAPRGDEKRALQKYLKRIEGPKYLPDAALVERVLNKVRPDLDYLQAEWGITFPDPANSETENLFDDSAVTSIAALLNDLAYAVESAGLKVHTRAGNRKTYASGGGTGPDDSSGSA